MPAQRQKIQTARKRKKTKKPKPQKEKAARRRPSLCESTHKNLTAL
jgi:hypothetical protein